MQKYSLEIDDFSNNEYTLIGIHTTLEDYKLAYLLNKNLSINFFEADYKLDFKKDNTVTSFLVYEYTNSKLGHQWYLISNVCKTEKETKLVGLFEESQTVNYLIPEKKKVDFFLKLEGDFTDSFVKTSIEKIHQISQIITSYTIEVNTLKSKENLIF